jgi:C_GCAxxG_C_C family probable redox protein
MDSNSSDIVKKLFVEKNYSCSQTILVAHGEQLGLEEINHKTMVKISSAFAGGIARTGNICGALNGALMIIGLKYGGSTMQEQQKVTEIALTLLDKFKAINGSILCRELINHDLVTVEDIEDAFKKNVFKNCLKYVEDVSLLLEEVL